LMQTHKEMISHKLGALRHLLGTPLLLEHFSKIEMAIGSLY
jgi:hypothetical protein